MKCILVLLLAIMMMGSTTQAKKWSKKQLKKADTAIHIAQLTPDEKIIIQYLNLARLFPMDFALLEVIPFEKPMIPGTNVEFSSYKKTLLEELHSMPPGIALQPDSFLIADAKCFVGELAQRNILGHQRTQCPRRDHDECILCGMMPPKLIAIQLLIDQGRASLIHRKNCLKPTNRRIGCSQKQHGDFGACTVVEIKE